MERIGDTIETIIRGLTSKKTQKKTTNPEEWLKKTLTKKELGHIKFHYFRKGTLGVLVDSAVWKYSLNLKKNRILSDIQKVEPEVKEIRFNIGDIE